MALRRANMLAIFPNCNESQLLFEAGLIWLTEAPSLWVGLKDDCES